LTLNICGVKNLLDRRTEQRDAVAEMRISLKNWKQIFNYSAIRLATGCMLA